jgi:hypothetical protein
MTTAEGWRPSPKVPGSGQLDERERVLTARVHTVVTVEPGTIMVKPLAAASIPRYLRGEISAGQWGRQPPFNAHTIAGTVARLQDTGNLRIPADFFQAFRLDFPGSPFSPNAPVVHTMEIAAIRPSEYVVAFGAPSMLDPEAQLPPNSQEVRETAYAMIEAAEQAGVDPNSYRMEIAPWPYSGTGLSAAGDLALPLWEKVSGPIPTNARIVEHGGPAGPRPIAVYRGSTLGWQQ